MKLSQLFVKTQKQDPSGEESINAKLLIRGGFIYKEMAGAYTFLPLWLRVLNKIENIIRKHMDTVWNELVMTALAPKQSRERTNRLDTVDVLMQTSGANEASKNKSTNEYILNSTHEEMITPIVQSFVKSYKDLPVHTYQIQSKFRNEARAKSGILRGREFRMKDLYSFHTTEEDFLAYYEQIKQVYVDIFVELWLWGYTHVTLAWWWDFTDKFTHEFQTICDAGEDTIYVDQVSGMAINEEVRNEETKAMFPDADRKEEKAAEVWNIFPLETKFTEAVDFTVVDAHDNKIHPIMWSYGIGPSRVMWVIVEKFYDEQGIVWPTNVAPFEYVIICIWDRGLEEWQKLYTQLLDSGVDVCLDDRDLWPGAKFKDAELIWYPTQIVVGNKTLEQDMSCEVVKRATGGKYLVKIEDFIHSL